jgi:hypothetical protein
LLFIGLRLGIAFTETFHATFRIDILGFAGEEGMALRTGVDVHLFHGGAGVYNISARTLDGGFFVFRMYVLFHALFRLSRRPLYAALRTYCFKFCIKPRKRNDFGAGMQAFKTIFLLQLSHQQGAVILHLAVSAVLFNTLNRVMYNILWGVSCRFMEGMGQPGFPEFLPLGVHGLQQSVREKHHLIAGTSLYLCGLEMMVQGKAYGR